MAAPYVVKAPGVIKLFGEHAVVYGKLALAAAIGMYSEVQVERTDDQKLTLEVPILELSASLDESALKGLYLKRKSVQLQEFIESSALGNLLPWASIAARLVVEREAKLEGVRVRLFSGDIPPQKGLASSASLAAALTVALAKVGGVRADDNSLIDMGREGDRIIHRNAGAGAIDFPTSYYGGYVSYSKELGATKEGIKTDLKMLLVDTGPKKSTAEMVGRVTELYRRLPSQTMAILSSIEQCSVDGIVALKKGDLQRVGALMYKNQDLLKKLDVSSRELDRAVEIARNLNLLGAKLSGGGGGGIAIAAVKEVTQDIIQGFERAGFSTFPSQISQKGARDYL